MFNFQNNDAGDLMAQASGGGSETDGEFGAVFDQGDDGTLVDAAFGRGTTDADRTYVRLKRSDGVSVYLYVDTGTTLVVSATKP